MKLIFLILAMLISNGASAAALTPVCFEVTWKSNHGPGPSGKQAPGAQKFITINGGQKVDFFQDSSRTAAYDSYGKTVWSVSRGCVQPYDFRVGRNTLEFSFIIGEGALISEGWLSVWVNIFLPNRTSPSIGHADYQPDPSIRQWSMVRSLDLDLAALAPELDAQVKQKQLELWRLSNETMTGEISYDRINSDYEAALDGVRGKDFFAMSLEDLARFQEASNRYQFLRKDLEAKKLEILRKTESLRVATEAAKGQLEAAARTKGFDLNSEQLLGLTFSLAPLEPFRSPGAAEQVGEYPYAAWAEQAVAAMKADLELGLRDQFLAKALAWQSRVASLIDLLQSRSDLSKAELNAFEEAVAGVNSYVFGDPAQNRAGIISQSLWFNDLGLDPAVAQAIDGELTFHRPETAKRLKAAINQLSSVEGLVQHLKAAATLAQMYKAAQSDAELAFVDKMMLGVTAMIEAAPSVGACLAKNYAAGSYGDFYELYYELDFCTGQPNDENDRFLAAASLTIEAGSLFMIGPFGPLLADKLALASKFLKRMLTAAYSATSKRVIARLETIEVISAAIPESVKDLTKAAKFLEDTLNSAKKAERLIKPQHLDKFSVIEKSIVGEADSILESANFVKIKAAHESGQSIVIKFGERTVQYEPGLPSSGMTMFGENGFIIGREAFASVAETHKTILHELHRLVTSKSANGVSGELAAAETKAAFEFAEKAYEAVK